MSEMDEYNENEDLGESDYEYFATPINPTTTLTETEVKPTKPRLPIWATPPWPEWDDSTINAEVWEENESVERFIDPTGMILPKSIKPVKWVRPEFLHDLPKLVDWGAGKIDLINANIKICERSDEIRFILSEISELVDHGVKNAFQVEGEGTVFVPNSDHTIASWSPWDHIYSNCKAGLKDDRPTLNRVGKYYVRLYFLGAWRRITVDDQIPLLADDTIALPISSNGELWPVILIKALLKLASLYWDSDIAAGVDGVTKLQLFNTTTALTGWVHEWVDVKEPINNSKLWTELNDILPKYHSGSMEVINNYWTTGKTKRERLAEQGTPQKRKSENEQATELKDVYTNWWTCTSLAERDPDVEYLEYSDEDDAPSLASFPKVAESKKTSVPTSVFSGGDEAEDADLEEEQEEPEAVDMEEEQEEPEAGDLEEQEESEAGDLEEEQEEPEAVAVPEKAEDTDLEEEQEAPESLTQEQPPESEKLPLIEIGEGGQNSVKHIKIRVPMMKDILEGIQKFMGTENFPLVAAWESLSGKHIPDVITVVLALYPGTENAGPVIPSFLFHPINLVEVRDSPLTREPGRPSTPLWKTFRWKAWAMKKGLIPMETDPANIRCIKAKTPFALKTDWYHPGMGMTHVEALGKGDEDEEEYLVAYAPPGTAIFQEICGEVTANETEEENGSTETPAPVVAENKTSIRSLKGKKSKKKLGSKKLSVEKKASTDSKGSSAGKPSRNKKKKGSKSKTKHRISNPEEETWLLEQESENENNKMESAPLPTPVSEVGPDEIAPMSACGNVWFHVDNISQYIRKLSKYYSTRNMFGSCFILRRKPDWTDEFNIDLPQSPAEPKITVSQKIIRDCHSIPGSFNLTMQFDESSKILSINNDHLEKKGGIESAFYLFSDSWMAQEILVSLDVLQIGDVNRYAEKSDAVAWNSSDENGKEAASDENGKKAASDENGKEAASDENDKEAASDENGKKAASDENDKEAASDENGKEAASDENGKEAASDENGKKAVSYENDNEAATASRSNSPTNVGIVLEPWDWRKDSSNAEIGFQFGTPLIRCVTDSHWSGHVTLRPGRNLFRIFVAENPENKEGIYNMNPDTMSPYVIKFSSKTPFHVGSRNEVLKFMTNEPVLLLKQSDILAQNIWALFLLFGKPKNVYVPSLLSLHKAYCPSYQGKEPNCLYKKLKRVHLSFENKFLSLIVKLNEGVLDRMMLLAMRCLFVNPILGQELLESKHPPGSDEPIVNIEISEAKQLANLVIQRYCRGWLVRRLFILRTKGSRKFAKMEFQVRKMAYLLAFNTDSAFTQGQSQTQPSTTTEIVRPLDPTVVSSETPDRKSIEPTEKSSEKNIKEPKNDNLGLEEFASENEDQIGPEGRKSVEPEIPVPSSSASTSLTLVPNPPKWSLNLLKDILKEFPLLFAIYPHAYCVPHHITIRDTEGWMSSKANNCSPFYRRVIVVVGEGNWCTCMIQLQVTPPTNVVMRVVDNDTQTCLRWDSVHLFIGQLQCNKLGYTVLCYRLNPSKSKKSQAEKEVENPFSHQWKLQIVTPSIQDHLAYKDEIQEHHHNHHHQPHEMYQFAGEDALDAVENDPNALMNFEEEAEEEEEEEEVDTVTAKVEDQQQEDQSQQYQGNDKPKQKSFDKQVDRINTDNI